MAQTTDRMRLPELKLMVHVGPDAQEHAPGQALHGRFAIVPGTICTGCARVLQPGGGRANKPIMANTRRFTWSISSKSGDDFVTIAVVRPTVGAGPLRANCREGVDYQVRSRREAALSSGRFVVARPPKVFFVTCRPARGFFRLVAVRQVSVVRSRREQWTTVPVVNAADGAVVARLRGRVAHLIP